jgi:hypothetical protein
MGIVTSGADAASATSFMTVQSVATAAGTTTLTSSSAYHTIFTGTTTQTLVLPDATTLFAGQIFKISNNSTGLVTVNTNGGTLLITMLPGSDWEFVVTAIGTSAGTWVYDNMVGRPEFQSHDFITKGGYI